MVVCLETLGMQVYLTLATFVASLGASRLKPAWIQVTRCPTGLMVAVPAVDSYFLALLLVNYYIH